MTARLALLLALTLAFMPGQAFAHAEVLRTEPPSSCGAPAAGSFAGAAAACPPLAVAPLVVRVLFTESVSPVAGGITVVGPSGRRIDRGPAVAEGGLLSVELDAAEEGTYGVRWRFVAEDAHPGRGAFAFSVGRVTASTPSADEVVAVAPPGLALQIGGRWLHFLGFALGFGTLAFGTRRWVGRGIWLMLLAAPIALLGQTASLGLELALDGDVLADTLGSTFGRALGLRLAAALLLWTLIGIEDATAGLRSMPMRPVALALGFALATADAASAHAASFRPLALGMLVQGVHTTAMALWLGALLSLPTAPPRMRRIVVAAVALVVATGAVMAAVQGVSISGAFATPYAWVLGAKLGLVALTVVLAARAARRLETVTLLIVLALAGALVSLPPPR